MLTRSYNQVQLSGLAAVVLGGEFALPLALLLIGSGPGMLLAAGACFFLSALFLRFVLVYLPHVQS